MTAVVAVYSQQGPESSSQPACRTAFSQLPRVPTMATKSQRPKGRDGVLSSLNKAIDALDLAKETTGMVLAKTTFGSASNLLTTIRVSFLLVYACRLLANPYRTLWPTRRAMSNWGLSALASAKPLTGGWTGDERISSVGRSSRRLRH